MKLIQGELRKDTPGLWEQACAVATPKQIFDSEEKLEFELSPELKELYTRVGNGGFGPDYGILGIEGGFCDDLGEDAVASYLNRRGSDRDDPYWFWPEGLLPICHVGCAMYICVDCTQSIGEVIWFEPNPHEFGGPWTDAFYLLCDSVDEWLMAYLNGEDLFELAEPYDFGCDDD